MWYLDFWRCSLKRGQMLREDGRIVRQSLHHYMCRRKKRKKTKVRFSSRKTIVQSCRKQSKIKSKVHKGIASIPRTLNFGGDDVADLLQWQPEKFGALKLRKKLWGGPHMKRGPRVTSWRSPRKNPNCRASIIVVCSVSARIYVYVNSISARMKREKKRIQAKLGFGIGYLSFLAFGRCGVVAQYAEQVDDDL